MVLVALAYLLALAVLVGAFVQTPTGEQIHGRWFTITLLVLVLSGVVLAVERL